MQNDSRKLPWYVLIWKDPLEWARWVGRSRLHLLCAVLLQVAFWGIWVGSLLAVATVPSIRELGLLSHIPLVILLTVAFLSGVWFPAAYLYALYRLIRLIDERSEEE